MHLKPLTLSVTLLSLTLLGLRSRIKAALARLHSQIGRLKSDTQLHTPKAVLMNALLALPGPLALAGAGACVICGGHCQLLFRCH